MPGSGNEAGLIQRRGRRKAFIQLTTCTPLFLSLHLSLLAVDLSRLTNAYFDDGLNVRHDDER